MTSGFFCSPPERVNLASKSRSGAPLWSLSDLLKGLAPSSRNANQPTRPNLTSSIPPSPSQGTLKVDDYARGSSPCSPSSAIYNPSPSMGNQIPPITARCPAPGPWPWPQGPGPDPAGGPSSGPTGPCPIAPQPLGTVLSRVPGFQGSSVGHSVDVARSPSLSHQPTTQQPGNLPLQLLALPLALLPPPCFFITSLAPDNPMNQKKGQNRKKGGSGYGSGPGVGLAPSVRGG